MGSNGSIEVPNRGPKYHELNWMAFKSRSPGSWYLLLNQFMKIIIKKN